MFSIIVKSMNHRKVVLFGNCNHNTLGKARSFGEAGYIPVLIWVGPRYNLVRYCKYIKEWYNVDTISDGVKLLIEKFSDPHEKTLVSIEGDGIVGAMDEQFDVLKKYFYFYNAGKQGQLSYYLEKANLTKAAEEVGFRVPQTELLEVGEMPIRVSYPLITKAADSYDIGWKTSTHICKSENELRAVYNHIKSKRILVQEYVTKKNELMLEGISVNGGNEVFLPIQGSFYRLPIDAYGSFGFFEEYHEGDVLFGKLKTLLQKIGFSGVFEVEFIIAENNELFFLEINFRDTMWNHAFTQMGINLNKIWAESELAGHLEVGDSRITTSPHLFMTEFGDYGRYVKSGQLKLSEWWKDFRRCKTCMIYDKTDLKPLLVYFYLIVVRKFERIGLAQKDTHIV